MSESKDVLRAIAREEPGVADVLSKVMARGNAESEVDVSLDCGRCDGVGHLPEACPSPKGIACVSCGWSVRGEKCENCGWLKIEEARKGYGKDAELIRLVEDGVIDYIAADEFLLTNEGDEECAAAIARIRSGADRASVGGGAAPLVVIEAVR